MQTELSPLQTHRNAAPALPTRSWAATSVKMTNDLNMQFPITSNH